jgi:hypothetical protein
VYRFVMSTLTEIEAVVDRLSLADQEQLLRHLEASLRGRQNNGAASSRRDWMQRLDALRNSISSGTTTLTSEQILTDLREE